MVTISIKFCDPTELRCWALFPDFPIFPDAWKFHFTYLKKNWYWFQFFNFNSLRSCLRQNEIFSAIFNHSDEIPKYLKKIISYSFVIKRFCVMTSVQLLIALEVELPLPGMDVRFLPGSKHPREKPGKAGLVTLKCYHSAHLFKNLIKMEDPLLK